MISARRFSLQGSVWRQHAPMIEQVVRWINSREVQFGRPIRVSGNANRNGLIAETGFRRAAVNAPLFDKDDGAEREARSLLALLPRGQFGDIPLSESERLEATLIQQNTAHYVATLENPRYFHPVLGCGVVDSALGDIIHSGGLVEIKSVVRPFRGTDLRQILVYATMKYASGSMVEGVSLYNPRRARLFSSSLDEMAYGVCGRSAVELMQDLVDSMVGFQVSA
jgi:hypothetical protein